MKRILMLPVFPSDPTLFRAGSIFEMSFPVDTPILLVRPFMYREARTLAFRIQQVGTVVADTLFTSDPNGPASKRSCCR
ncbi:MAG TPA: hypothetical protein VEW46_16970 [Pyrinomonadaceae bacterium]|nr:hypothetical protein [Pyrinomonadaceae bacterium]